MRRQPIPKADPVPHGSALRRPLLGSIDLLLPCRDRVAGTGTSSRAGVSVSRDSRGSLGRWSLPPSIPRAPAIDHLVHGSGGILDGAADGTSLARGGQPRSGDVAVRAWRRSAGASWPRRRTPIGAARTRGAFAGPRRCPVSRGSPGARRRQGWATHPGRHALGSDPGRQVNRPLEWFLAGTSSSASIY